MFVWFALCEGNSWGGKKQMVRINESGAVYSQPHSQRPLAPFRKVNFEGQMGPRYFTNHHVEDSGFEPVALGKLVPKCVADYTTPPIVALTDYEAFSSLLLAIELPPDIF